MNILQALSDNIKIDLDKCVFCGLCVDTCIMDNLRLKLAPCRQACPLGVNVQGYVQLIARGLDDEAREMVLRKLPFPEIVSRICDAPCEDGCHRGQTTGQPIGIRPLKRYLFNEHLSDRPIPEKAPPSGKKAAIVGSGPAGLCAAYDLALAGHAVTVFEADEKPGGLLRYGIPAFRLPVDVVDNELTVLDELGVTFKCGVRLGSDVTLNELEEEFDAVILAAGMGSQRRLGGPGEELKGVWSGMDLLKSARSGAAPDLSGKVVVVGGGNAAVDAAQTALRLNASEVVMVSLEKEDELPAFKHEIDQAVKEGVTFQCGWGIEEFMGADGKVTGVKLKGCKSVFDEQGRFCPCFCNENSLYLPADAVIIAIGQAGDGLKTAGVMDLQADRLTLQTEKPKVFLAGDCYTGPSSVVRAMASGRQAAESVDRMFASENLRYNRAYSGPVVTDFPIDTKRGCDGERIDPTVRSFSGNGDFKELEESYSEENARQEAKRCYSCGAPFGMFRNCWFCLPCEVECPKDALWVDIPYLLR